MNRKRKRAPRQSSDAGVEEFARLTMELAVLDPDTLAELGDEMLAESQEQSCCTEYPNKTS